MAENLREKIRWMEQELLSQEFTEEDQPVWDAASDEERALYQDEDDGLFRETSRRGRRYLLLFLILGILAVMGWWYVWRI